MSDLVSDSLLGLRDHAHESAKILVGCAACGRRSLRALYNANGLDARVRPIVQYTCFCKYKNLKSLIILFFMNKGDKKEQETEEEPPPVIEPEDKDDIDVDEEEEEEPPAPVTPPPAEEEEDDVPEDDGGTPQKLIVDNTDLKVAAKKTAAQPEGALNIQIGSCLLTTAYLLLFTN